MADKNHIVRNFKIPEKCRSLPSDKLLLALENLLFYPPNKLPDLKQLESNLIQKRFLVCQESEKMIQKIKEVYGFETDKIVVNMAIISFLNG